ncbi:MAG TPA: T9SS type A sorting domain-containing protein, partial [Bacteroidia bacterium]
GPTNISGTLNVNSTGGSKTLGDLTIASGGVLNVAVSESWTINGNIANNGTFNANLNVYTLTGAGKTITGANPITIDDIKCNGSYTNYATVTLTNSLKGTGTWTQGTTGILNLSIKDANFTVTNFDASATGNTVNYSYNGNQTIRSSIYYNLTTSASGIKTLPAATTANGTVTISAGTTLATSNFNLFVGIDFLNSGAFTQGTSTVTMGGTAAQNIGGTTATVFNNLTVSNSSAIVSASTNFSVTGTFTVGAGAIFSPAAAVIISGAGTLTGSGTIRVTRIAATPDFLSQYTITNKVITGLNTDYIGAGNQNVNALSYGSLTISTNGTRTVTFPASTVFVANVFSPTTVTTTYVVTGNTINFNGTVSQTIPIFNYYNLTSSSTGARVLSPTGTIGVASVFTQGTNAYTVTGSTVDFNGTIAQVIPVFNFYNLSTSNAHGANSITLSPGTIGIAGAFAPSATFTSGNYIISGNTVDYNGSSSQTIAAFNYNNLTSSSTGARTLASSGTIGVASVFTPGTNAYTITGSTVNFNRAGAQSLPVFNFYNLAFSTSGLKTFANGTTGIAGSFTISGTASANALSNSSTVNYNGSIAQTVRNINYYNLTLSSSGAKTFANGTSGIFNLFTISGPTVDAITNSSTIDYNGNMAQGIALMNYFNITLSNAGTKTFANGTTGIAGAFTIGGTASANAIANSSTVDYNGSIAQAVRNINYYDLTLSNTGAKAFANGTTGIFDTFTISGPSVDAITNSSTIDYNGNIAQSIVLMNYFNISLSNAGTKTFANGTTGIAGAFTVSGSAAADALTNSSTIDYNGTAAQTIRAMDYYNLTSSSSGARTLPSSSTVGIYAVFTPGTNPYTITGSLVDFKGSISQTIPAFNYYDLVSSSTGTRTLDPTGIIGVASVFTPGTNAYTITGSTVSFNGTAAQTFSTAFTFYNLTINNAAGVSIGAAQNLISTLTISQGTFTTTGQSFTLVSNASGTARIATIPSGANIVGNVVMQRYINSTVTSWRLLGSAVTGQTLQNWQDDFVTSGFPGSNYPSMSFCSMYWYDETKPNVKDTGWTKPTSITNSVPPGKGYLAYIGPVPLTVDVTGPPAKFSQTFTLNYTANNTAPNIGWNLIANPYPSSIDWDAAGWTKTRVNNAIYVWNPDLQQYSSYVAGIGTNGGTNIIPSSQGFFVQANAASPVLSLTEVVKSAVDQGFMRMMQPQSNPTYNITLNITGNNNRHDQTVVRFDPNATWQFDGMYDAYKFPGGPGTPYICSIADSSDLSVNSVPQLDSSVSIPVRVKVSVSGSYTIGLDSVSNLPNSSCLILEDLLTGTLTDLHNVSTYTFSISDTTNAPRFVLHVSPPVIIQTFPASCYGMNNGKAVAQGSGTGPWSYTWTDINNNVIRNVSNVNSADTLQNIPAGTYHVIVNSSNTLCGSTNETLVITQPFQLLVNSTSTALTCYGSNDGSISAQVSGGTMPYSFSWSNNMTTASISNLAAGTYSLTVTDTNGCTGSISSAIAQPAPFIAGFNESNDSAFLSQNGMITFTSTTSGATSYSWSFSDTSLTGNGPTITHYSDSAGTYTVTFIASNGTCSDTAYANIIVIDDLLTTGTGGNDLSQNVVVTQDENGPVLYFNLNSMEHVSISLFDVTGNNVMPPFTMDAEKGTAHISIPALSRGMYLLRISDGKNSLVKKMIF